MRSRLLAIGALLLILLFSAACSAGATEGIDSIPTDNYANPRLDYYYYIPSNVIENGNNSHSPILIAVPGLSDRGEHLVSKEVKEFADEKGVVIIAPSFIWDEQNWSARQSYQYPAAWSGDALLKIINQVKEKTKITPAGLYLFGFSAGAQFALRFCLWKPEQCIACAAHGSGGTIIPDRPIAVRFFVTVGTQDGERTGQAKTFYNAARNLGIDVIYREYDAGHWLTTAQIEDSLDFFTRAYQELAPVSH